MKKHLIVDINRISHTFRLPVENFIDDVLETYAWKNSNPSRIVNTFVNTSYIEKYKKFQKNSK